MGDITKNIHRVLHVAIALCLSCMASFVFLNVVLRYFFNSGLTWAEEASRYLFIWLIFLGAIVASEENAHLGVDTLVQRLSLRNRRFVFIFNNILLAITMALCAHGAWKVTILTMKQVSASMRMPLAYVYVSGFICCTAMTLIALVTLYRLITNKVKARDLVMSVDSEDAKLVDDATAEGGKSSCS